MDALSLLFGGAAGAGLAALLGRTREDRAVPAGLADELQWGFLVHGPEDAVVVNKDGALLASFRYAGPDVETAGEAERDAIAMQVNDALLPFGDNWMWHVDAERRPAEPYPADAFHATAPDVSVPAWIDAERRAIFTAAVPGAERRGGSERRHHHGTPAAGVPRAGQFVSEYTITLTYLPPPDTYSRAAQLFVSGAAATPGATAAVERLLGQFNAQVAQLGQRLAGRFRVERLAADALVSHLHACLTAQWHAVTAPPVGAYLNSVLASQEFVPGFVPLMGSRHVHVIAVESYPADVDGRGPRLDFLHTLAVPYRWSSRFIPVGQRTADKVIKRYQQTWFAKRKSLGTFVRDMASNKEKNAYEQQRDEELFGNQDATAMLRDLNNAESLNSSSGVRFGYSTQVIIVSDEDATVSAAQAAAVQQALFDRGFTARLESVNATEAFIGSLPGHGYQNLRRPLMHSANLADLWPLTSVWPGLAHNPSQFMAGKPPLMHLATDGSTPFRFNLHVGDVGHAMLFGGTGGGKSTFLGLTEAQWQRYPDAATSIFDYDYSHWALATACGAQHYDLCSGRADAVAFQPLADVDNPEERKWAISWLGTIFELQGLRITPEHKIKITRALELVAGQPRHHRTLTELSQQLQAKDLQNALRPYLRGGENGTLFDASSDAVGNERFQVFELKHLLAQDAKVVAPAFLYLFHRVSRRLDGRPTLTVFEEMHALLKAGGPMLAPLKEEILTQRKRNGAIVMVFHTPAQLTALPVEVKSVLVESCLTRIFLPNATAATPAAAPGYYDLGLTDAEIALVAKGTPKRDYYVRSPLGSRVVKLDLGPVARAFIGTPPGMGPDEARAAISALAAEHGGAWPLAWLARFGLAVPGDARIIPTASAERLDPSHDSRGEVDLAAGLRPAPGRVTPPYPPGDGFAARGGAGHPQEVADADDAGVPAAA